jgi:hypothetical protein
MAIPTAPKYDDVRRGGPGGIRIPQEVGDAAFKVVQKVSINASFIGGSATTNAIALVPFVNQNVADIAGSGVAGGAEASLIIITGAGSGATTLSLPAAFPGHLYCLANTSGQACTLKVTGQTGVSVANNYYQLLMCNVTDIVDIAAAIAV